MPSWLLSRPTTAKHQPRLCLLNARCVGLVPRLSCGVRSSKSNASINARLDLKFLHKSVQVVFMRRANEHKPTAVPSAPDFSVTGRSLCKLIRLFPLGAPRSGFEVSRDPSAGVGLLSRLWSPRSQPRSRCETSSQSREALGLVSEITLGDCSLCLLSLCVA